MTQYRSYDLKIGYTCNNDCIHCVIQDSKKKLLSQGEPIDISTNEAISLLTHQVELGLDSVTITGGEATLRKDLPTIVNFCLEHHLAITLQTNGRLLSSANTDFLFNVPNITFVIALHGSCQQIHDAINQRSGSFTPTLNGIRLALKKEKNVIIKTVISKINMSDLPFLINLIKKEGINDINLAFPHAQGAARENFDIVVPKYSELRPYLLKISSFAKQNQIHLTYETIPLCILPEYPYQMSELVYEEKEVKCTQVREKTFDWNETRKAIKTKMSFCEQCFFNEYCEGPWSEYVEKFGISEFSPVIVTSQNEE